MKNPNEHQDPIDINQRRPPSGYPGNVENIETNTAEYSHHQFDGFDELCLWFRHVDGFQYSAGDI
jgi:hypothetical protein